MQGPDGGGEIEHGGWSTPYFDDQLAEHQRDQLFRCDALLLGRQTFEAFAGAWPPMEESEGDFAVRMNTLPKHVASRTLKAPLPWNGTPIEVDVADAVAGLKEQPGEEILIYGSAQLLNTLLAADLIDRYQLMVFPITLGNGKRLFTNEGLKAFRLSDASKSGSGVAILTYERAGS